MNIRIFIVLIMSHISTYAQQEPQYTQYMYNMSMVNPGYMINEQGIVQLGGLYRTQWVGIEGAPKTANIFANIPLSNNIELSVNYLNDNIGGNVNMNQNMFNIDIAYKINLKNDLNLSFGLKTGFDNLNFNSNGSNVSSDAVFGNTSKTAFSMGAGMFLFKDNFYVGMSSSNLIPSNLDIDDEVVYNNDPHLFLIGGYVFTINSAFKLKPSTVVKYVNGAPLSFDLSINALFNDHFELGVSYRYEDAVSALAGFYVTPDLRIGYAYDFNISELNSFNSGSHEIVLLYTFDVLGLSKKYSSPRFY